MNILPHNALTIKAKGRAGVILTAVSISLPASSKEEAVKNGIKAKQYSGIWDTGATNSVITKKVVDDLGLKPIGVVEVCHAQGKTVANKYLVNIVLPNNVVIPVVTVTEGILNNMDMLIGMDVITLGDFSITNKDGKTTMSFRIPSCKEIDYVPESNEFNKVMRDGSRKLKEQYLLKYK